jgi:hypothetical protein
MSLPNTLQGVPARTSVADSLGPSAFTFMALYPGQRTSNAAESTFAALEKRMLAARSVISTPHGRGTGSIVKYDVNSFEDKSVGNLYWRIENTSDK